MGHTHHNDECYGYNGFGCGDNNILIIFILLFLFCNR
ncbi:sporulation protein YjcZ [Clostridium sporogenes]|nr:sporulation protein YjcZ [Clostridium sporogenes]NFG70084.1 sporulation protein YjcZ [Clostridium sporogenes]